jgi:hypothetical protein
MPAVTQIKCGCTICVNPDSHPQLTGAKSAGPAIRCRLPSLLAPAPPTTRARRSRRRRLLATHPSSSRPLSPPWSNGTTATGNRRPRRRGSQEFLAAAAVGWNILHRLGVAVGVAAKGRKITRRWPVASLLVRWNGSPGLNPRQVVAGRWRWPRCLSPPAAER